MTYLGLVPALQWQAREFEARAGIPCETALSQNIPQRELDPDRSTALFRIAQELLTNIMRQPHASSARLALHEESDGLALEVSDNGRGIAERAYVNPTTLGLRGMQERVRCSAAHFTSMAIPKRGRLSRRGYPSGANMSKTTPYQPCSILVGDDHAVVRRGLRHVIAEECDRAVFDEALTGHSVLDAVQRQDWAVVILDINMPDKNGLEVLKDLKAMRPALPVLILSHYAEAEYAVGALRAGAAGYLTKESASEELAVAIHKVLAGGRYVSPSFAEQLAGHLAGERGATEKTDLTPISNRQHEAGAEFYLDKSFGFERFADIHRDLAWKSGPNSEERNVL